MCFSLAQMMICLLVMIYRSPFFFIAFHGSIVSWLFSDVLLLKTSHRLLFHRASSLRVTSGEHWIVQRLWSHTLPCCRWFLTQQRMFWYLAHRPYRLCCPQPNISSRLIHVPSEVSYCYSREGLIQSCSVLGSEVRSESYRKIALPIFTLTWYSHIRIQVCLDLVLYALYVLLSISIKVYSYEAALRQNRALS